MRTRNINPFFMTDGYKTGHQLMYPLGTEEVLTNGTVRSDKHAPKGANKYMAVGAQMSIQQLHEVFEKGFFKREEIQLWIDSHHRNISDEEMTTYFEGVREQVVSEIETKYSGYLGTDFNGTHIRELWDLGYLPIEVKILPEGTMIPMGIPFITVRNTHKEFGWVTNFLETPISAMIWKVGTAASIAFLYKKILLQAAIDTDDQNLGFVDFQAHNFSMRGMDGLDSASNAAIGHDILFKGDDTLRSLVDIGYFYDMKDIPVFSVNATEHSVMCAGEKDTEIDTFRRLMKTFPVGPLSIVSDTWDLWKVLTETLVELKDEIMAREGKIIIRPDSGNPVDIICGKYITVDTIDDMPDYSSNIYFVKDDIEYYETYSYGNHGRDLDIRKVKPKPEDIGVIELLWNVFGGVTNEQGYKVLDPHVGAIYGDSITPDRAQQIVDRLKAKGFASTNIVLGVGSYTYQMNTRDTFGFAMKATNVVINGKSIAIFKDPITDDGRKKSAKGRLVVINASGMCNTDELLYDGTDKIVLLDEQTEEEAATQGLLYTMYKDGAFVKRTNFKTIRYRADMQVDAELIHPELDHGKVS